MLDIKNLHAKVQEKEILKGLNLKINPGEVHVIMGPNGQGKSTLAHLIAGRAGYDITEGKVSFEGRDLLELEVDGRARLGIFLSFQHPVELPGVSNMNFLKSSFDASNADKSDKKISKKINAAEFLKKVRAEASTLGFDDKMLKRSVNQDFSGGEKKRFEVLQMHLLNPKFIILDEIDSGLDIDSLKVICESINQMRNENRSFLIITHYRHLLNYVKPDFVHVLDDGKIVKSGAMELLKTLEEEGYKAFR